MTRWYRAYEGTVTDAKLGEVAMVANCSRSVAIATWHAILESCATKNDGGKFDATPRRIAVILIEPVPVIESIFIELSTLGMISGDVATAWASRQFESDSSTERSRKHRQHKRNDEATLQQRDGSKEQRRATPPETETEAEKKESEAIASAREPKPDRKKAKTRIAEDAQPTAKDVATSAEYGLSEAVFRTEWRKFRAHHVAAGSLMANWSAAWEKWCGNMSAYQPRAGPPGVNGSHSPTLPPERDVHAAAQRLSDNIANGSIHFGEPPKPYTAVLAERREREREDSLRLLPEG